MQDFLALGLADKLPDLSGHEILSFFILKAFGPEGGRMRKQESGSFVMGLDLLR